MRAWYLTFLLVGCANTEIDQQIQHDYYEAVKAQAHSRSSRASSSPTISLQCGQHLNACKGLNFSYTDPDQQDGAVVINRARTTSEVNAEAFRAIIPKVVEGSLIGLGIYKGADLLHDAIKGTNNAISSVTTNTSVSGKNNVMDSSSGNTIGNSRDAITSRTDNKTSSTVDSNDSSTLDSNDTSTVDSNDNNSTNNSYPVTDSNNDNSRIDDNSEQNTTADPNYPPVGAP